MASSPSLKRHAQVAPSASAVLNDLTVEDGVASVKDPVLSSFDGGAIYNQGTLTVNNSTLLDNGASNAGGAIYNSGMLSVVNSNLSGNVGVQGGGIFNTGTLNVSDATFSGNVATSGAGAGIDNTGAQAALTVINSTFYGNLAESGGTGGGLANSASADVIDSTFADNYATTGGGILNGSGSALDLLNTLVANNTAVTGPDVSGSVSVGQFDLLGNGSGQTGIINGGNNIVGVSAELGPLGNYGGPTATMALLPGSPAIGTGAIEDGIGTDQRGFSRTNLPDIGACRHAQAKRRYRVTASMRDVGLWTQPNSLVDSLGEGETVTLQSDGELTLTTASGTIIELDNGGNDRSPRALLQPTCRPFSISRIMDRFTTYNSTTGWTLLDNQTATMIAGLTPGGQTCLFDLKTTGVLYQYSATGWTLLDNQTATIVAGLTSGGQTALFDLKNSGLLYQYSSTGWTLLDNRTQTVAAGVTSSGTQAIFDLKTSGACISTPPTVGRCWTTRRQLSSAVRLPAACRPFTTSRPAASCTSTVPPAGR